MNRLALLVTLLVAGCGGTTSSEGCAVLGGSQVTGGLRALPDQVMIDVKFLAIDDSFFDSIGVDIRGVASPLVADTGGVIGGTSAQGRDIVVDSAVVGGSEDVPYLIPNNFSGFSSIVNLGFVSPFLGEDFKVFVGLPFPGDCVTVDDASTDDIDNFAGGADLARAPATDPGFVGSMLSSILDSTQLDQLIQAVEGDSNSAVLSAPRITVFDKQRALIALQDLQPQVGDLNSDFNALVTSIVASPFTIYTGVVLDFVPVVDGSNIRLEIRPGTQVASFERSVPADVGGQSVDVEIPAISLSTVSSTVEVPDGGTIVLGGLMLDGMTNPTKGIPLLDKIPILGSLLRDKTNDNQDLVIIITPMIVQQN